MSIIPNSRPKLGEAKIRALLKSSGVTSPVAIVGIRGYYSETFAPSGNQRGVYDDAIFVVSPNSFAAFNGNTDPSVFRKGIATLSTGIIWYRKGKHGLSRKPPYVPYDALRPATDGEHVLVTRDGIAKPWPGTALNIHKGGNNNTYSEGCQTLPPDQYSAFIRLAYSEMDRAKITKVPYLLVNASALEELDAAPTASSAQVLEKILGGQMTRDNSLTKMLTDAAHIYSLPSAFVLAIASRETGIVNTDGDGGHGRGVMQIDDRWHKIASQTNFYKDPSKLILYGCDLLSKNLLWARKTWPQYSDSQHLKIAAAAYNAGQGGANKGVLKGDADLFTAHHNYGGDVLVRMAIFEKLLGKPVLDEVTP